MTDFKCVDCGKTFEVEDYDGRWDHPPGEPVCADCEEKRDEFASHPLRCKCRDCRAARGDHDYHAGLDR